MYSYTHNIFVKSLDNFKSGRFTIDLTDHILIFIKCDYYFSTGKQIRYRLINESTLNSLCHKFDMIVTSQINMRLTLMKP